MTDIEKAVKSVYDRFSLAIHAGEYTFEAGVREAQRSISELHNHRLHVYSPSVVIQEVTARVETQNAWNKLDNNDRRLGNSVVEHYNALSSDDKNQVVSWAKANDSANMKAYMNHAISENKTPGTANSTSTLVTWALNFFKY